jgi:fimbrial isopeptide formation D2 family protein/LPXTG-motif cell wall-anchored protein
MKKFTKLLGIVLIIALVMSMGITALAADDDTPAYKITVTNTNSHITVAGKTYTAYKLFDATYSGTAVAYSIDKDSYFYTTVATKAILDQYFTFTTASGDAKNIVVTAKDGFNEAKARELADKLQPYLEDATEAGHGTVADGKETVDIAVAGPGYFLVDGKADPKAEGSTGEVVAAVALTTAKPTAEINPKADAPSVDKKITKIANGTDKVESDGKTGNGSVGDKVEYELTSTVPDMTGYDSYQFIYTDTMTKGLTFNDDIAITIDGTEYTSFTKAATTDATTGVTTIKITFTNFIAQAANKGKAISIKYSATINEEAVTKEDNKVHLEYSNNPYDEHAGTPEEVLGKTPDSKTEVYDTHIELTKVDKQGNKLTGAKFKIEGNSSNVSIVNEEIYQTATDGTWYRLKDGTYTETAPTDATKDKYDGETKYAKVTQINATKAAATGYAAEGWVKSDSTLSFNGLGEGTYTITELVSPEGYNLLTSSINVVVTFDATNKEFTAKVDGEDATVENNVIKFDVENNKGVELPSTGGIGTTIFYVVGSIMVVAAGVLLITKKRMSREG